jgi:hypothetical protein
MVTADFRLQQWFKTVQECEASGLTIKTYCEEIGLREHQYYYMKKKVREAVCRELTKVKGNSAKLATSRTNHKDPVMWAEVEMREFDTVTIPARQGNIQIANGDWVITIESGTDTELLTEALKAVKRVCC